MNDQRPCPLCNGTGHIQGPIHSPAPTRKIRRKPPRLRPAPPPIIYEPITPYDSALKRLRSLSEKLDA